MRAVIDSALRLRQSRWRTDDLDPIVGAEFLPKRGSGEINLRVHETRGLDFQTRPVPHDRARILQRASEIGCDHGRTNKDQGGQHRKLLCLKLDVTIEFSSAHLLPLAF